MLPIGSTQLAGVRQQQFLQAIQMCGTSLAKPKSHSREKTLLCLSDGRDSRRDRRQLVGRSEQSGSSTPAGRVPVGAPTNQFGRTDGTSRGLEPGGCRSRPGFRGWQGGYTIGPAAPPSVTVSPTNVPVTTPLPQNSRSQTGSSGTARPANAQPRTNPLVLYNLDSLNFDLGYGYTESSQGFLDTNYLVNRALFDINRDLPWLYSLVNERPVTPAPQLDAVAAVSPPADIAKTVWHWVHSTPVATPQPLVQAGRGISGLLTYLETDMNLAINETVESPAGPLFVNGTATLTLDWGDGESESGITDPGGPYPNGQLTRHDPNSGDCTITVTANWVLTWELASTGGGIPLQTSGAIDNFPVRAMRAVARPVDDNTR